MLSWLSQNLATILITLLLVAIVAAIIIGMVRKSKKLNPPAAADAPLARTAVAVVTITKRSNMKKRGMTSFVSCFCTRRYNFGKPKVYTFSL